MLLLNQVIELSSPSRETLAEKGTERSDEAALSPVDQKARDRKLWSFRALWGYLGGFYFGCREIESGNAENTKSFYRTKKNVFWFAPVFWCSLATAIFLFVAINESHVGKAELDILHVSSYVARIIVTVYNVIFGVHLISSRNLAGVLEESEIDEMLVYEKDEEKEPRKIIEIIKDSRAKPRTIALVDLLSNIMLTCFIINVFFFGLYNIESAINPVGGIKGNEKYVFNTLYEYVESVFLMSNVFLSLIFVWKLWAYWLIMKSKVKNLMAGRETMALEGGDFGEKAQQAKTIIFEYLDTTEYINSTWKWFHMTRMIFGTLVVADLASSFYDQLHGGNGRTSNVVSIVFYLFVFLFLFTTLWLTVIAAGIGNEWFYDLILELLTENEMMPESDKQKENLRNFFTAVVHGQKTVGYEMLFTYVTAEKAITLVTLVMFVINYTLSIQGDGGDGGE